MSIRSKVVVGTVLVLLVIGLIVFILGPVLFASVLYPLPEKYRGSVDKWVREYCQGIDNPHHLVSALIMVESGWREGARSSAGAIGMTQFIPSTAVSVAKRLGVSPFTPSDLTRNPDLSIRFGSYYICTRIKDYGGNTQKGLIAYNGGGGAVIAFEAGNPVRGTVGYANKVEAIAGAYNDIYGAWWQNGVPPPATASSGGSSSSVAPTTEFNVKPKIVGSGSIVDFWQGLLSNQDTDAAPPEEGGNALTNLWKIFVPDN